MQIDLEHLHYWMCAIRESKDSKRTLDAFWRGQLLSKQWLIEQLSNHISKDSTIDIHGGWVGVLSSMIFQSKIPVTKIRSIDIDPSCEEIARTMNKKEEIEGRFSSVTADMCSIQSNADIIINTSCEHITQEQYNTWISNLPKKSLLVLQSNDFEISEHVRIANSLENFKEQSCLNEIWAGTLKTSSYNRWMIIGTRK